MKFDQKPKTRSV